jgi:hypothetical protein
MPNLKEFFNKPEILQKNGVEEIPGTKPCSKCDKDAEKAFWDPSTFIISWKCPDGHDNQFKVNG